MEPIEESLEKVEALTLEEKIPIRETTIECLPLVHIQDILSRLPIDSIFHFRLQSKIFRSLTNDRRLSMMHYYHHSQLSSSENENPTNLLIHSYNFDSIYYIPDFNTCDKAIKLNNPPFKSWFQNFQIVGSIHGFICMVDRESAYRSFIICNPVSGDWFKIPEAPGDGNLRGFYDYVYSGFGYSYSSKNNRYVYKVIRMRRHDSVGRHASISVSLVAEIFTLGSNSWRRIGTFKHNLNGKIGPGVFVNGYLHWTTYSDFNHFMINGIRVFDVEAETFETVSIPHSVKNTRGCVCLGALRGRLMLVDYSQYQLKVWSIKDYSVQDSWMLEFVFLNPIPGLSFGNLIKPSLLGIQKNGNVLLECESSLHSCNPRNGTYQQLRVSGLPNIFSAIPHVGTLVRLSDVISFEELR